MQTGDVTFKSTKVARYIISYCTGEIIEQTTETCFVCYGMRLNIAGTPGRLRKRKLLW